jgi:hypothetical protein
VITLGGATCYWRHLGSSPYHVITVDRPPVFLHDTIYWPMSTTFPQLTGNEVVAFNVKTEIVGVFPVPKVSQYNRLFVLEESLGLIRR